MGLPTNNSGTETIPEKMKKLLLNTCAVFDCLKIRNPNLRRTRVPSAQIRRGCHPWGLLSLSIPCIIHLYEWHSPDSERRSERDAYS
jgi:hypothetical protein